MHRPSLDPTRRRPGKRGPASRRPGEPGALIRCAVRPNGGACLNARETQQMNFTASAAVVRRLGDQLIRQPKQAFFELVKNAYDADATRVEIRVVRRGAGRIEIHDDGAGMSEHDIREKWCRLASENKVAAPYTERFGRRRLGAKGIGRFSAAKLGDRLKLTTRPRGARDQITVSLDFSQCTDERDLGDIALDYREGKARATLRHGTIIRIEDLRHDWTRRDLAALRRDLETLIDPESDDRTFQIALAVSEWRALSGPVSNPLVGKESHRLEFNLEAGGRNAMKIHANGVATSRLEAANLPIFGPVHGSVRYFASGVSSSRKRVGGSVEESHLGVKVYRDRCRVRPYGELKDDWLGLTGPRPDTGKPWSLRGDSVAGSVHISTARNPQLVDSSDRESGMDRNREFEAFAAFVRAQLVRLDDIVAQERRSRTRRAEAQARQRVLDDLARCLGRLGSDEYGRESTKIDRRRQGESGASTTKPGPRVQDVKPPDKTEWRCRSCGLTWRVLKAGPDPNRCMEGAVDRNGALRQASGCGARNIERTRRKKGGAGKPSAPTAGAYATATVGGRILHLVISDDMGAGEDEYVFDERTITINGNHPAYRTAYRLDLAAGTNGATDDQRELPAVRTHCAKCACLAWGRFHYQRNQDFDDFESRYDELLTLFCKAVPGSSASPEERRGLA